MINWYFTDFFTNENPRKSVEKQNMIFFTYFMFIWTKEDDYPRNICPRRLLPRGNFGQENFPPGDFCPEKPSLPRRPFFFPRRHLPLWNHCVIKNTLWQSMWFGAECWQNRNQTLGDCSKRKVDLQTKEQLWNFMLLRAWFYFSQAIQSHVQQRKKTYYVALLCFSDQSRRL